MILLNMNPRPVEILNATFVVRPFTAFEQVEYGQRISKIDEDNGNMPRLLAWILDTTCQEITALSDGEKNIVFEPGKAIDIVSMMTLGQILELIKGLQVVNTLAEEVKKN